MRTTRSTTAAPVAKRRPRLPRGRSSTLNICGPGGRRPGGTLFLALCELADRFAACRRDPLARRVGAVLTHVALHSTQAGEDDDFRLALRSWLDVLVETDPIERWSAGAAQKVEEELAAARRALAPRQDLPPEQPTPVPYPRSADILLLAAQGRR